MDVVVVGCGVVGSALGAACQATGFLTNQSTISPASTVLINGKSTHWNPQQLSAIPDQTLQIVCTRVDQTPWTELADDALIIQNGLDQPRSTCPAFFAADRQGDCVVISGHQPRLVIERPSPRFDRVLDAWRRNGLQVDIVTDATAARWEKAILNATVGPISLGTGLSVASIMADPQWWPTCIEATTEAIAIAHAADVAVRSDLSTSLADFFSSIRNHQPSIHRHPQEWQWTLPPFLRRAEQFHITCPALKRIAALHTAKSEQP